MHIELSIEVPSADIGLPTVYRYRARLDDKIRLETIEAHAETMFRLLDNLATTSTDDDDDEDDKKWKENKTH